MKPNTKFRNGLISCYQSIDVTWSVYNSSSQLIKPNPAATLHHMYLIVIPGGGGGGGGGSYTIRM